MDSKNRSYLYPYFLGAYGENDEIFEKTLVEFLRDHIFWRRNFHPEDPPTIPVLANQQAEYIEFAGKMKRELHTLTARLKRSVPFFHPRYMGHMVSELLMPGLIAQIITILYNPNNVAKEAGPVTIDLELEVGNQLARMLGYNTDITHKDKPVAWGHLTSGGTIANFEGLWNARVVKFYPVALQTAFLALKIETGNVGPLDKPLSAYSKWELVNITTDEVLQLRTACLKRLQMDDVSLPFSECAEAIRRERLESMGLIKFFRKHQELGSPVVMVPVTAHYSWVKGMKVLGLGADELIGIPVKNTMRLDPEKLDAMLADALDRKCPVLAVIGILGTTEFGSIDPIDKIVALRNKYRKLGLDFALHIDAAWGGYLASIFRGENGAFLSRHAVSQHFRHFPSEAIYRAFESIPEADSVTIDPHKQGYLPYGNGAFIARNSAVTDLLQQGAAYIHDIADEQQERQAKLRNLGQYILEGSKPGAPAAATWVTHRVLPLNHMHFGRLVRESILATEYFYDRIFSVEEKFKGRLHMVIPFRPDSNLICLAFNPAGNTKLAVMNAFSRRVYTRIKVDAENPIQIKAFIGSYTSVFRKNMDSLEAEKLMDALGISRSTFTEAVADATEQADNIFLFRHTLMNPWISAQFDGSNYIDKYCLYLAHIIEQALDEKTGTGW